MAEAEVVVFCGGVSGNYFHHFFFLFPFFTQTRPGNNSWLSGIPGFDLKIFCQSAVLMTFETASNMHKHAEFYEAE